MTGLEIEPDTDVLIFFNHEHAAPYRMFGKYLGENDEYVKIEGTVGEWAGKTYKIPKLSIKMMEVR